MYKAMPRPIALLTIAMALLFCVTAIVALYRASYGHNPHEFGFAAVCAVGALSSFLAGRRSLHTR